MVGTYWYSFNKTEKTIAFTKKDERRKILHLYKHFRLSLVLNQLPYREIQAFKI